MNPKNVLFIDVEAIYTGYDKNENPELIIPGAFKDTDDLGAYSLHETEFGDLKLYTDGSWNFQPSELIDPSVDINDLVGFDFNVNTSIAIDVNSSTNRSALDNIVTRVSFSEEDMTMFLASTGLL